MAGFFISLEGGDGVGKSTIAKLLFEYFNENNYPCTLTREPGGTIGAEAIRDFILQEKTHNYGKMAEILLFSAARIDHIEELIKPRLSDGEIVICDRFTDSTLVYQSDDNISETFIENINDITTDGIVPDITFLLDIPAELAYERRKNRYGSKDQFENQSLEIHENRREKYLNLAEKYNKRIYVIDATEETDKILETIKAICNLWLKKHKWSLPQT
ncbi:dTMP kinase [Bartonella sp. DGB1]|uniref:dTMP kinase n=1 Tax=Bartonella sp. DGB1 TaxID=3239807 RepID=UPI00352574CF